MDLDQAISETVRQIRSSEAQSYGYDVYPFQVALNYADQQHVGEMQNRDQLARENYGLFSEAAWELSRRGYLRPGVKNWGGQATDEGGYSFVRDALEKFQGWDEADLLICQPGSLAQTLLGYRSRFGPGFAQRAQEAIKSRNAEAWLASCAMAGAAAESVLLAVAIDKVGEEERIMKTYNGSGGRRNVINLVVGNSKQHIREKFTALMAIVSIWRDSAAHGEFSTIGNANVDEALRQLLHLCQWVDSEWETLTS